MLRCAFICYGLCADNSYPLRMGRAAHEPNYIEMKKGCKTVCEFHFFLNYVLRSRPLRLYGVGCGAVLKGPATLSCTFLHLASYLHIKWFA